MALAASGRSGRPPMSEWTSDDARIGMVIAGERNFMLWKLADDYGITPYEMVNAMIDTFYELQKKRENNGR